ncbi:MAG: pyridoxamine 5'-phosphate oxidase [Isosphaeraceae bacterium]
MTIADLRKEYALAGLGESDVDLDPIRQFQKWFDQALSANLPEPNAMTLATSTLDGFPSARIVLLKGLDDRGFAFYTNFESRKGRELLSNPRAALVFHWIELERQVRIEGEVEHVSESEADAYYRSRPLGSRLGAWISKQSEVVASREVLERDFALIRSRFPNDDIPRPPFWGGFRVVPVALEFWQGRPSRLHDRLRYRKESNGEWILERLSP